MSADKTSAKDAAILALGEKIRGRFDRKWRLDHDSGCHVWTGMRSESGYGVIKVNYGRFGAHRVSYLLNVGAIPEGLVLDHLCRNRACVNHKHLEPVTTKENLLRGTGWSARHAAKTHCPRGHEYVQKDGYRRCLQCQADVAVRLYWRKRERYTPMGLCAHCGKNQTTLIWCSECADRRRVRRALREATS